MEIIDTRLAGVKVLTPHVFADDRGFFLESFRGDLADRLEPGLSFVQDNHSRSRRAVVRGMHFQPGQAKLVRCARGAIFDVVVDIRQGSGTYGQWEGFELDDQAHRQLFIPSGFAHGFCVLSELADVAYKVSAYYDPAAERGFRYDDPAVGIGWPFAPEVLAASPRDREAPSLNALATASALRGIA